MKTLVVSDQPLTVIAMQSVLRRLAPRAEQLDASYLGEAMQLLTEHGPVDLMVLDLDTHGMQRVSGAALFRFGRSGPVGGLMIAALCIAVGLFSRPKK